MTDDAVRAYLASIGRKGGSVRGPSKARKLSAARARAMAKAKAAKRAAAKLQAEE